MTNRLTRGLWRFAGGPLFEQTYRQLQTVATGLYRPGAEKIARPAARERSFEACVADYGLSETDLRALHRRRAAFFYLLVGGALFALGFGATAAFSTFGPGLAAVAVLAACLFVAGAAGHSLRCWQIRTRRLGSFRDWWRQPRQWFPWPF